MNFRCRWDVRTAVAVFAMVLTAGASAAQQRERVTPVSPEKEVRELYDGSYALLVGVSRYQSTAWPSLQSVPSDIENLAAALKPHGFQVETALDPSGAELRNLIRSFIARHRSENGRVVIFFAGHGYTRRDARSGDRGYFVAADSPSPVADETGFISTALDMSEVIQYAKQMEVLHALVLFDSCFSGSVFQARSASAVQKISDLTKMPVREFLAAGSALQTVPSKSQFTPGLIEALAGGADMDRNGYVTGSELGLWISSRVEQLTQGGETPQFGKILDGNFSQGDIVFVTRAHAPGDPAALSSALTQPPELPFAGTPVQRGPQADALEGMFDRTARALNVDVNKITAADFQPSVVRDNAIFSVRFRSSAALAELLQTTSRYLQIDGGDEEMASSSRAANVVIEHSLDAGFALRIGEGASTAPQVFRIRFQPNVMFAGRLVNIGPFEYKIDVVGAARAALKDDVLKADRWATVNAGNGGISFEPLLQARAVIRSVRYGFRSNQLDKTATAPKISDEYGTSRIYPSLRMPNDADAVFVQLEFIDGTMSPVRSTPNTHVQSLIRQYQDFMTTRLAEALLCAHSGTGGVLCVPRRFKADTFVNWVAIDAVQIGDAINKLGAWIPVDQAMTVDYSDNASVARAVRPEQVWQGELSRPAAQVFARFKFRDGSLSDTIAFVVR